jgi:hypothetical protein
VAASSRCKDRRKQHTVVHVRACICEYHSTTDTNAREAIDVSVHTVRHTVFTIQSHATKSQCISNILQSLLSSRELLLYNKLLVFAFLSYSNADKKKSVCACGRWIVLCAGAFQMVTLTSLVAACASAFRLSICVGAQHQQIYHGSFTTSAPIAEAFAHRNNLFNGNS